MANLNIAERRLPQDGRIMQQVEGREIDMRISTVPTMHGESVVMRILDKGSLPLEFTSLGQQVAVGHTPTTIDLRGDDPRVQQSFEMLGPIECDEQPEQVISP